MQTSSYNVGRLRRRRRELSHIAPAIAGRSGSAAPEAPQAATLASEGFVSLAATQVSAA